MDYDYLADVVWGVTEHEHSGTAAQDMGLSVDSSRTTAEDLDLSSPGGAGRAGLGAGLREQ